MGADVAWMSTALDTEQAIAQNLDFMIALLDIWKCFEQIIPALLHALAALVGMPTKVLSAYMRLMSKIKVVNCLSLGVGEPYTKACSIPEGCHWSMTLLALLTYPWIQMVRQYNAVVPRALADDLSIWAKQPDHDTGSHDAQPWWQPWMDATESTLNFLEDIGAITAHHKSMLLTSNPGLRANLKKTTWGREQRKIPVTGKTRDLGAFFNSTCQRLAGTTKDRSQKASHDAIRIAALARSLAACIL